MVLPDSIYLALMLLAIILIDCFYIKYKNTYDFGSMSLSFISTRI
ncbi:Uncharacterised protein [Yersinia kristensenii]|nr:Uncharacterised protein [Yersinia kristensenii]